MSAKPYYCKVGVVLSKKNVFCGAINSELRNVNFCMIVIDKGYYLCNNYVDCTSKHASEEQR